MKYKVDVRSMGLHHSNPTEIWPRFFQESLSAIYVILHPILTHSPIWYLLAHEVCIHPLFEICCPCKAWIHSKSQRGFLWMSCIDCSCQCKILEVSANKSCPEEWSICNAVREWSRYLHVSISGYFMQPQVY